MSALTRLKARLPDAAPSDDLLNELLYSAEQYILMYCNRSALTPALEEAQVRLALIYYNRMGIEGETSHAEGGVSRGIEDLPTAVQHMLDDGRLIKAVKRGAASTT